MSDYQGKRFSASRIPDPAKSGAARAPQQGRTSSPQQPRAPRPVTPAKHRRQDTPAAYRPSSYSTAKKPPRSSAHAAPSSYTEPSRKKRRSVIPILLIIIGIGLIVAAAAIFINAQIGYKQASESYQKIENQYVSDKDASGVPIVDFNALAQTNPEVVGWIYAPGTNINYPVVQTNNNSKYLNTLFDGTANASGAIFLDSDDTAPGMVDQQTTIYGHHMNDGSMFAGLMKFKDKSFWEKHKTVSFDTLTDRQTYEVIAVFKTVVYTDSPESFKYYQFVNAETAEDFTAYVEKCKELSLYDTDVTAEYGDKLLTLSTCEYSRTNGRLVVVAKLINE